MLPSSQYTLTSLGMSPSTGASMPIDVAGCRYGATRAAAADAAEAGSDGVGTPDPGGAVLADAAGPVRATASRPAPATTPRRRTARRVELVMGGISLGLVGGGLMDGVLEPLATASGAVVRGGGRARH